VDQQNTLPNGTPAEVRREVETRIRQLAPGGGYVLAVSPNIQADVPPENIIALFDAARAIGKYPIRSAS
jgi:uroporphyrinogen decarboxylase